MAELSNLVKVRGQLKGQLTRFRSFVNDFVPSESTMQLETRLERAEQLWYEFDQVQTKIEIAGDEIEPTSTERESFEISYFESVAKAKQIIRDKAKPEIVTSQRPASSTEPLINVKLPTLNLPVFNGSYDQWLPFYDSFSALIHVNKDLANIQKFYYLKSCLKGAAAEVIQSLEASSDNYEVAWNLLQTRFENKRLIIYNHIKALFEIPHVSREPNTSIRHLLDNTLKHLRALKNLKQPVDSWDSPIIYLISTKLDQPSRQDWESTLVANELPTLKEFEDFLTKRAQIIESLGLEFSKPHNKIFSTTSNPSYKHNSYFSKPREQVMSYVTTERQNCPICKENTHQIFNCAAFRKLATPLRIEEAKKHRLCLNCLSSTHYIRECYASGCKRCNKKHNTLLHLNNSLEDTQWIKNTQLHKADSAQIRKQTNSRDTHLESNSTERSFINTNNAQPEQGTSRLVSLCTLNQSTQVLLSTAVGLILDSYGYAHECRILLDSGSQSNFITRELCDRLNLNTSSINIPVGGINHTITSISHKTNATIKSRVNEFQVILPFLVLPKITDQLPLAPVQVEQLQIPDHITLADNTFHIPGKIDMLLGANIFWDLLCVGQIKLSCNQPILQKTKLGWIITGNITQSRNNSKTLCHFVGISDQLEKFWKLEECEKIVRHSIEEQECENHFVQTHEREETGRFVVSLPFKENITKLGDSKQIALRRLYAVEKRFNKQPELKEQYIQFIDEYKELGHMIEVTDNNERATTTVNYLPHHAVLKESSTTTKLRVVFDGSCKTSSGVSINDILMVGPTIQQDIFSIILRFRQHRYVITADIEKMYRQILINNKQRDLLRIVWRPSTDQPIKTFKLNTITYGTATAPFLAIRCLHQLAIENQANFPEASNTILQDFYVDDLLSGGDTIEKVKNIKNEVTAILNSAGFKLRKWMSNDPSILDTNEIVSLNSTTLGEEGVKTLGVLWHPDADNFRFRVNLQSDKQKVNKRSILATIAQIYDPLGLVGPSTIRAKLILQQLWKLKGGWDESLPSDLHTQWVKYRQQLTTIGQISIPRRAICLNPAKIEIHAFCDASELAYGTCIYIRSLDRDAKYSVRLLCAKSRVAPLKNISLPRLELCGALLLARLLNSVSQALTIPLNDVYCWSDSTITLAWIAGQPSQWKTFIANRVAEIQEFTKNATWRHIKSEDNPADVISRGLEPDQLSQCSIWWNGPEWLTKESNDWPKPHTVAENLEIPETKTQTFIFHSRINELAIFSRYSSLTRLKRVVAYCLRFKHNSRNPHSKLRGAISVDELGNSMLCLIKLAQNEEFSHEIKTLSKNQPVRSNSKLITLYPFIDKVGLIRVGGRLKHANIPYDQKHPIVLPSKHMLTNLIIRHEHYKQLHAGAQQLLANIRTRYWPIAGKNVIKQILRKCIICFRVRPFSTEQLMGNLPKSRLTPSRAFANCGVDYAGPFNIKVSRNKTMKSYLCLFVCLATKAVHLEVVSNLTTQAFLNALKRFISRRGRCANIYSDNGSNFNGARNKLNEFAKLLSNNQTTIINYLTEESIRWHFIPPRSPHFGGLWEAGVKSVKTHLYRIVGNALLTFEELYTVFTQIEACLNSRPLIPLSTDPTDYTPLTPGHFLIGDTLNALPQESVVEYPSNRLTRYQYLTQMVQHFWGRWSKEYLNQLQQRTKWKTLKLEAIRPGTMVVLKEDHLPPLKWQLGRITKCFPGEDGIIRVVEVKTCSGVYKRAVSKVCILPIETV